MSKLNLLILDANVVIHLHECGIWAQFITACDVHLPQTVIEEAVFYEVDGDQKYIDLNEDIDNRRIKVFNVELAELQTFSSQFDPIYIGELDPGELEALAFLCRESQEHLISSGDAIVYRVLGRLNRSHQGISLEEVLQQVGQQRANIPWPYTKKFRERYTHEGAIDLIQGRGLKK